MKTFFISDTHFSHKNIIKYEERPFSSVDAMDEAMILNWNNKVSNNDRVFIIGDFIFGDEERALEILDRLNGQKFMIKGNHDSFLKSKAVRAKFGWIKDYAEIKIDGKSICMFHYPIHRWNKAHHGSIHLFGHVHSNYRSNHPMDKPHENSYNVGVDVNNFEPCTLEEIIHNNKKWVEVAFCEMSIS